MKTLDTNFQKLISKISEIYVTVSKMPHNCCHHSGFAPISPHGHVDSIYFSSFHHLIMIYRLITTKQ